MKHRAAQTRGYNTRERIVQQAAQIFNQHGYAGTAISELMRATGLRKGGIYRHFASKEELAEEAFRYAWSNAFIPRSQGVGACATSPERLRCLVANFVHERPKGLQGGCPLMNTAIDADDTNPALFLAVQHALAQWQALVRQIVREGQRKGELQRSVSASSVATTIIGTLEGALLLSRIERTPSALHIAEKNLDAYIRSIEKKGRRRRAAGQSRSVQ